MDPLKQLVLSGHRNTKTRRQILSIFQENHKPLEASEIKNHLEAVGFNINRSTVYRELWFLLDKTIVQEVSFGDGKTRYELTSENCHHHLVCNDCGDVQDISLDESNLLTKVNTETNFQIERHSIEFFGKCVNCK